MVPTFALYPLPLMPRPGVASDDLPTADGDFATVLAALGPEGQIPDQTVALSCATAVAMVVPAMTDPQEIESRVDDPAPETDPLADDAWPNPAADATATHTLSVIRPAPDSLAPNTPTQIVTAPLGRVPLPLLSNTEASLQSPVMRSEPTMANEGPILPVGPVALAPAPGALPEAGAKATEWAAPAAVADQIERHPAPELPAEPESQAATKQKPKPGMATQAIADELPPVAPLSVHPFAVVSVPIEPTLLAHHLLPIRKAPTPEIPSRPLRPEPAVQADPIAMVSLQNVLQSASQIAPPSQPMREGATDLPAAASAPPQMQSPDHFPPAPAGQTPLPTRATTADPIESSPLQAITPNPATGLGVAAQMPVLPNPDIALGQAWDLASDSRETAAESYARPAEPTLIPAPPHTRPETLRPPAADPFALDRPALPDNASETRAILRQLAPTTPDQDGAVEIALFPKGLGQVKLDIQHGPDGARIVISADRPETLDLIRRHSADLVTELRAAGMVNPVVSFAPVDAGQPTQPSQRPDSAGLLAGGGFGNSSQHTGGSPQGQPAPRQDSPLGTEHADQTPPPYRRDAAPRGGLILRL